MILNYSVLITNIISVTHILLLVIENIVPES
jgi:hypothetical protein